MLNFFFAHLSNGSLKHILMNRLVFTLIALMLSIISFAQNEITPDPRISEAFGQSKVADLQKNNPDLLVYYSFFLKEGFIIRNYGQEKVIANLGSIPKISLKKEFSGESLPDLKNGNLNILKFDYKINPDSETICRIDESGYVIVFLSGNEIENKLRYSDNK